MRRADGGRFCQCRQAIWRLISARFRSGGNVSDFGVDATGAVCVSSFATLNNFNPAAVIFFSLINFFTRAMFDGAQILFSRRGEKRNMCR